MSIKLSCVSHAAHRRSQIELLDALVREYIAEDRIPSERRLENRRRVVRQSHDSPTEFGAYLVGGSTRARARRAGMF
jgi:hypothetical protein